MESRTSVSLAMILRMARTTALSVAIVCTVSACRTVTGSLPIRHDGFTKSALDAYSHFSDGGNPWSVAPDTLRGDGVGIQSVLIRNGAGFTDGWVEIETSRSDDGGLVLRFLDNEHYYLLAIRDDAAPEPRNRQNLQIYVRSGPGAGGFTSLWQKDIDWPRGTMHRVRFDCQDGLFTVSLDGTPVGAVSRVPPSDWRGFGIRHYGLTTDWHARFRNFRWSSL